MNENELPANLKSLWEKAVKSLKMQNFDYVTQLALPVVKEAPEFLDARRALRKAAVQLNAAKSGGKKKSFLSAGGSLKAGMKIKPMIQKDPLAAMAALEDELVGDPTSQGLNDLLFDAAMAAEMPEVAHFALTTLKDSHPKDTGVLKKLAHFYEGQGEHQKAADMFTAITAIDPSDLDAVKGVTQAATRASMEKNKLEEGGVKRDDEERKELELLDRKQLTDEQIDKLIARFTEEYNEDNNNVVVVKRLGTLYEKKKDLDTAISYYEWASHLTPGDSAMEKKITDLKDTQRDHEFSRMEKELAENPDTPDADQKRARLEELKQERLAQKLAYAKDQVEKNPTDPQLRFLLADYLVQTGNPTDAIPELQRAKNNPHVRTKALLMLGKCFSEKNMLDLAVNQLEEAEKDLSAMDGVKKEVVYERALLHEKRGEKEAYLEALKQIYEVDYGYRDVAPRVEASYN